MRFPHMVIERCVGAPAPGLLCSQALPRHLDYQGHILGMWVDKVGDDETCLITTCVATLSQFCGLDWKETVFVLFLLC